MVNPSRRRRTYEPDKELFERLIEQSGKSIVDFADQLDCGETTLRKLLYGSPVAAQTLKDIAEKLKMQWHDLLSDSEKKRIGIEPIDVVPSNPSVQPTPATGPPMPLPPFANRLFQLPAMLPDFTGRTERIADLTGRLRVDGGQAILYGMGGIGKSSLAVKTAYEVKDHFPDAQLFLDLRGIGGGTRESPLTPTEVMVRIIHAFHPEVFRLPKEENELAGFYRSVLAGKRALIVLDNAKNESQLRPLLTAPPPVGFLITSRNALALDGIAAIQVDLLSIDESCTMLRRIVGENGSRAELNQVVRLSGYLPLALRVAGDFLRLKNDWSIARYIAALKQEGLRWFKIGEDSARDVEAVLKLSSAQLVRDSVDRAKRWHLLHIFNSDFDLPAAAAAWGADEDDHKVLDDLSDMKNRSLIIFDAKTGRYRLHDLMRPIAGGLFG
jgi:hypothetical protein